MANVKSSRSLPSLFAPRWGKGHIPTGEYEDMAGFDLSLQFVSLLMSLPRGELCLQFDCAPPAHVFLVSKVTASV